MSDPVTSAPPPQPEATSLKRGSHWPDAVLSLLVLAFAFAAASFPARNSDLWLHLATGRVLAQGEYTFGSDPFAYTTQGMYWANHSWLFDLGLYTGHRLLGDPALVVLKALAVVLLAGIMLYLSCEKGPFWLGGGSMLLAVLAMSPRLILQPACLSLLLLAICLWLLRIGGRAFFALPVVIALWVNVDTWFLLGPVLVALYWLGQQLEVPSTDGWRVPRWLLPACLAACLLSPHHIHALTLPAELSPAVWGRAFRDDVRFASIFAPIWQLSPLGQTGTFNFSAWAYYLLLFLSLVSFTVQRTAIRSWRFPIWVVFVILGAWHARLIPFFAVIAGPIMAINFRERFSDLSRIRLGRAGVFLASLALLALTWPGWLQGLQRNDRPLDWAIQPDPSLQHAAETLAEWRKQGVLPSEMRTFAMQPDVAHYCEWFCPGEKIFLDSRLTLFLPVATDYERLCLAMNPSLNTQVSREHTSNTEWERTLTLHKIGCLMLYDADLRLLAPALHRVNQSSDEWDILSVDGLVVFAGWKKAETRPTIHFDPDRIVFAPENPDKLEPSDNASVPLAGPRSWWDYYLQHPTGSTWEAGAAKLSLLLFEDDAARQLERQRVPVVARYAAGLLGMGASPGGDVNSIVGVQSRLVLRELFQPDLSERPSSLPLLAIRKARTALAAHPDDADAWLTLAQGYQSLGKATAEATEGVALAPLAQIRFIQAVTALVQSITFKPDSPSAHELLARLYSESQFFDLALRHRDIQLQLVRRAGAPVGVDPVFFRKRVEHLELAVEEMRTLVQDRENRFVIRSYALKADPLARARMAREMGLAGKALDEILLNSHPDLYGVEGLRLMLDLMLMTGRVQEAGELLDRAEMRRNPNGLGVYEMPGNRPGARRWGYRFPAFDWFHLCQSSATGNYNHAAEVLERMRTRMKSEGESTVSRFRRQYSASLGSEIGLGSALRPVPPRLFASMDNEQLTGLFLSGQFLLVERADLDVLEGMFLLERGRPTKAGEQFSRALALYASAKNTAPALPGQPLAQRYLERIRFFAQ